MLVKKFILATMHSSFYNKPCEQITGKYSVPLNATCFISSEYGKEIIYNFSDMNEDYVDYIVNTVLKGKHQFQAKKTSDNSFELKIRL